MIDHPVLGGWKPPLRRTSDHRLLTVSLPEMSSAPVPFLNLRAQHDPIRAELLTAINEVIDANAFAGGPFVAKFEEDFASFCQTTRTRVLRTYRYPDDFERRTRPDCRRKAG